MDKYACTFWMMGCDPFELLPFGNFDFLAFVQFMPFIITCATCFSLHVSFFATFFPLLYFWWWWCDECCSLQPFHPLHGRTSHIRLLKRGRVWTLVQNYLTAKYLFAHSPTIVIVAVIGMIVWCFVFIVFVHSCLMGSSCRTIFWTHLSHLVCVSARVFWFVGLCVFSHSSAVCAPPALLNVHTFSHTQSVNIHIHKWFKQ